MNSVNNIFQTKSLMHAKNITCIREDRILFDDLSFEIFAGDIIQVEGPNGAGKTSLLRILAGLSSPYNGVVSYQERSIKKYSETYHQELLYIGHLVGVKDELTAEENLQFNLALNGLDISSSEETLSQVNLLGFEDAYASHLSAGQHRRIALAQLWQTNAKLWILDEPFTAIDKQGVAKLEKLIAQHADNGGAVILTNHQEFHLINERIKKLTLTYQLNELS